MLSMWKTGGDGQPSLSTLQMDRSIMADVHPQEEDQVDKARENYRSPTMLEHEWKCRRKKREEMEDFPACIWWKFGGKGIKDVF